MFYTFSDDEVREDPDLRTAIDLFIERRKGLHPTVAPASAATQVPSPTYAAVLTLAQAKQADQKFQDPTKAVVKTMAGAPASGFGLHDIARQLKVSPDDLRGPWSGLTKITRRLTGDPKAVLIDWRPLTGGDHHGRLHPLTRAAFRDLYGII